MSEMTGEGADIVPSREQLLQDGYCVAPRVLGGVALTALQERFNSNVLSTTPENNFGEAGAFVVADYHDPVLVDLLTWPKALETISELGYPEPKLHNYYISTKPPGAEALPWHSDLFYDYDKEEPAELFLIYYLQDTHRGNGCLRVVPGSHLWSREQRDTNACGTGSCLGEVDVQIQTRDLFIGDRRILHATHPNFSDTWRTCVTIAYAPNFKVLPKSVQALIVKNQCLPPAGWWGTLAAEEIDPKLQALLPIYEGAALPIAIE